MKNRLILLTGATGYVGGRLLAVLAEQGCAVRCLVRRAAFLRSRVAEAAEVVQGDVLDFDSLSAALRGVDTAYYLVHSMSAKAGFAGRDRQAAENFARAAREAGVRRIIYLGGLGSEEALSPHLASRQQVGRILRESGVPTIEFRASIIIGSGSLSFEMIRALVHKLPVMVAPRWVDVQAQPIGIEDVIDYLVAALDIELPESTIYEIGGPRKMSYRDLMNEYARLQGLRRWIIPVPVLTPRLSGLWLTLVTPLYARVGRQLIDSIRNETVVRDERATGDFDIRPRDVRASMERALRHEDRQYAQTRWSDALGDSRITRGWGGAKFGNRLVDSRKMTVPLPPEQAFEPIRRIGGRRGWYFADTLWQVRGLIDLLLGGVGLRRGRRDPEGVRPGDIVDFWRVEAYEPNRMLRLFAEMKLPGRAWLQFEVEPTAPGGAEIRQTAIFDPIGLSGQLYWYLLYPFHNIIFAEMLRGIVRRARHEKSYS